MVFYRKYRPQKISELDLVDVREKLTSILKSRELPHAFLFTGSKGLGKTSSARILAKAINCTGRANDSLHLTYDKKNKKSEVSSQRPEADSIEPCNECEACVSITNGSNIDVLEIDAASNGGVEEIRVLRERVKFASSSLKKKVYIIDEVHMLSTGAFNALLKTLEEPPSHVVFILATTELHKLPATVVSRTFQVHFEKPTEEEITNSLKRVVRGEKLDVADEALHQIFTLADGSFRDGAKILEELSLAANGGKIDEALIENVYKTGSIHEEVYNLLVALQKRNAKEALEVVSKLNISGADFKSAIERMVDHLRGLLMVRNNIKSEEKDVPLKLSEIKELLELSNEAYGELKFSVIPQLPLELLIVKFCIIDVDEKKDSPQVPKASEIAKEEKVNVLQKPKTLSQENNTSILKNLYEKVNLNNKPAAAFLRSCKEALFQDGKLVITTPFPIHAERLRSDRAYPDIEKAAHEIFGDEVIVEIKVLPN